MRMFYKLTTLLFCFAVSICGLFAAQSSLNVISYDTSKFPDMKSSIMILDQTRKPVSNPDINKISIFDNSNTYSAAALDCTPPVLHNRVSLSLVFDLAIGTSDTSQNFFLLGQNIINSLINNIDTKSTYMSISGFDLKSYLFSDYSNSKTELTNSITSIKQKKASNSLNAFFSYPAGGMNIIENSPGNRIIVLVTDGVATFNTDTVIDFARKNNVTINTIYIGNEIPDEFKAICDSTSGIYFSNVKQQSDIDNICALLLRLSEGYKPCELRWKESWICDNSHYVNIKTNEFNAESGFKFVLDDAGKPRLNATPPFLEFSSVLPTNTHSLDIAISAVNEDIVINSFSLGDSRFTITTGNISAPLYLAKNDTHKLTIQYAPTDSAIVFTKLTIDASSCIGNEIYITGGFPNSPPKTKTLQITSPKCAHTLVIGDSVDVSWIGLLPKDVIQLEYSTNNGAKWDAMAQNQDALTYKWGIPNLPTNQLLIRAIQLWPNNVGKTLDLKHNGAVISAFFNHDASRVISACDDSTAVIWNANTGEKIFVLKGHTGTLNYACFDPSEKYAVTASKDSTAKVWNAQTGALIYTFTGHKRNVTSAMFNVNGDKIVTASSDRKVLIFETATGKILNDKIDLNQPVAFATFDRTPSGITVLTATNDGIARAYNSTTGNFIKQYNAIFKGDLSGVTSHVTYNDNGNKIAFVNQTRKKVFVFDSNTGDTLYTVTHKKADTLNPLINSSSFFIAPNGKEYLLTSGTDKSVKRWNANDGTVTKGSNGNDTLHIFAEHTGSVQTAVFNFDGTRLLTASWDSTAKIWNLNQRDLQMDTTDCTLRIAKAKLNVKNFNFGEVALGSNAILNVKDCIINPDNFPFKIKDIRIVGDKSFRLVHQPKTPFAIDSFAKVPLSVRFEPDKAGPFNALLRIEIPSDTIYAQINGIGVETDLITAAEIIDFGKVETDEFKDTIITAAFLNRGNKNVNLSKIYIEGQAFDKFKILSGAEPGVLAPGSQRDVRIRFLPISNGRRNSALICEHDGLGAPAVIGLFGEGINPIIDTLDLVINDISAKTGEIINIPVYIKNSTNNGALEKADSLSIYLSYNATLLEPLSVFSKDIILDGIRYSSFTFAINLDADSSIGNLKFKTAWGNDSISPIIIEHINPIGYSKLLINKESCVFSLNSLCSEGGTRLFFADGTFSLEQNSPNPVINSSRIEFELIEPGQIKLYITDINGKSVKSLIDTYMLKGRYYYEFNSGEFPPGVYLYVLESHTRTQSKLMQIVK